MSEFKNFKDAVSKQFEFMKGMQLFRMNVDKDEMWDIFLKSFPPGTNPMRETRTEYDCNYCKSFIRAVGGLIAIFNGKFISIWDAELDDPTFSVVAKAMAEYVKSKSIDNFYYHTEPTAGMDKNFSDKTKGPVVTWNHFFVKLPKEVVLRGEQIGPTTSDHRSAKDVMLRGLTELTPESLDTVLDLINQNSLYKGEENKHAIVSFQKLQVAFKKLKTDQERDIFCWSQLKTVPAAVARIRNTSIGTLLTDISEGKELDQAVASFEAKVAPTNYKRPTAVVTKSMIANAQKAIESLGLAPSLERRYATIEDITVNNILFVERETRKAMKGGVFEDMAREVKQNPKTFDKVEEVTINDFVEKILPKAESIEVMVENRHASNLVSLIAPVDPTAKPLFKWNNNFSWSYTGDLADSIKERVKKAGGKVDGDLRCSLSWYNHDDLDLHMKGPGGEHIYFANKLSPYSRGHLDVDMNAGMGKTRSPVENITFPDRKFMPEGTYILQVHQYALRERKDVGFEVEVEFDGNIASFPYAQVAQGYIEICQIKYTKAKGFEFLRSLPSTQVSKELWGVPSQSFHKVSTLMLSPNYWDEKAVGNKHFFFMLEGCKNEGKARPFFNEFLSEELAAHRKVLEIVGAKLKTEESERQLSGIGFSSTQRNSVLCKVSGSFNRTVKINF